VPQPSSKTHTPPLKNPFRFFAKIRNLGWLLVLVLVLALSWKAARLAQLASAAHTDLTQLEMVVDHPTTESLVSAGPILAAARQDLSALRREAAPLLWLGPLLSWAPGYGPDLAAARPLLGLADNLLIAADETYVGLSPLLQALRSKTEDPLPAQVINYLEAAQPRLQTAQQAIDQAISARSEIKSETLSSPTRSLIEKVDGFLPLMRDGLVIAAAAPELLGADRPKTYLILLENQDELRATGGFISAVGTVVVNRGSLTSLTIEDSYALDDFSLRYPLAPEPLRKYMLAPVWLLRDSNWSPDFPAAAALAEALYQAARPQPAIDGVLALDQSAIRLVLGATGPIQLAGTPEPIGVNNVQDYMRAAWAPAPGEGLTRDWWLHRKDFMQSMAAALINKIPGTSWTDLSQAAKQALDERHVMIWLKDSPVATVLAGQGWDGAIQPGSGDYVMVVDSNVGFNKVNAVVQTKVNYSVDFSAPAKPEATLTVVHDNPATSGVPCRHIAAYGTTQYKAMTRRCYWDYWRILLPGGIQLSSAPDNQVPGEELLSGLADYSPAQVSPGPAGITEIAGLFVLPTGQTQDTQLIYHLPATVLDDSIPGRKTYRLHIQKQPGTEAPPTVITLTYPSLWGVQSSSSVASEANPGHLRYELTLQKDITLQVVFRTP